MSMITLENGNIDLDAALIAADLGLDGPGVLEAMRARRLTAVCERGVGEDAGRHRVTFFHGNTQLRLIVDEGGQIVTRSVVRLHPPTGRVAARRDGDA